MIILNTRYTHRPVRSIHKGSDYVYGILIDKTTGNYVISLLHDIAIRRITLVVVIIVLRWYSSFCSCYGRIMLFLCFLQLLLLLSFYLRYSCFTSFSRSLFLSTTPVNPDSRSRRDYRYRCNQRQAKYYSILRALCPFFVSRSIIYALNVRDIDI